MAVIGEAFIDVKPRSENFGKETDKQVTKQLGGLGNVAKAIGATLAAGAAVHFVDGFVKAAQESQKISRVTDAVIKSTGAAAGLTATQVGDLATSLSNLSGVDDELIQSSENILLTFTNVRDAAGAGNDIFSRTTQAALDMATVLGGDPTSAIQQLGKALNDPAAGLTKLTRSGVVFTDQQKDMVKQLQASGDILGAQKVILDEVNREFGGAAAAAADPFERLKVVVGNLQEAIGGALIPVLAPAATGLANLITANQDVIAQRLTDALGLLGGVIDFLKPGLSDFASGVAFVFDKIKLLVDKVGEFLDGRAPSLTKFLADNAALAHGLSDAVVGIGLAFGGLAVAGAASSSLAGPFTILGSLGSFVGGLATIPVAIAAPVAAILGAAAAGELLFQKVELVNDAFSSLFGDTLAPFAAALTFLNPFVPLAVAGKALYDNLAPVRAVIDTVVGGVQSLIDIAAELVEQSQLSDFVASISDVLGTIDLSGIADTLEPIAGIAAGVGSSIADGFDTAVSAIQTSIGPAVQFLTDLWAKYGDQVTGILVGFRDIAVAVFGRAAQILGVFIGQIANVANVVLGVLGPALRFIAATVAITLSPLGTLIAGALTVARTVIQTFIGVVGPAWDALWGFVRDVVAAVIGPISDILEGFLTVIQGIVDIIAGIFTLDWERIWDGVGEIVSGAVEIVLGVLQEFLGFLGAVWSNAGTLLTLPFTTAWTIIQSVVSIGATIVTTLLQGVIDFVGSVWANIGTLLTAPIEAAQAIISGLLAAVVLLFTALPGQITDALSSFPTLLTDLGTKLIEGLSSAVAAAWETAKTFFTGLGGTIAALVGDLFTTLLSAGSSLIEGFISAVETAFGAVIHFAQSLGSAISGLVGDLSSWLVDAGKSLMQGFIDGIVSMGGSIASAVRDTITNNIPGIGDLNPLDFVGPPGSGFIRRLFGGASGMIVPGQSGQPFPLIAHGGELLINPNQVTQLAWNLANSNLVRNTGSAPEPTMIDARIINNGTIFGVEDLQALQDAQADRLADIVAAGRRP